ncbi:uncharacterized protein SAPINGB_P001124 [Magnusiomyces paraingens]|uniref:Phosphatidylethanolamine N-methyltransferase n=1 Tax=Magnusiomyces paraingens TaxID=2606893 RepID=A0A5E8B456_9ASCO|nr:uncharacterized protein SAPINGB_P001124 [Saprochaete ingens]VVT46258.1 unnamed protein product [Saprochaete ingens]
MSRPELDSSQSPSVAASGADHHQTKAKPVLQTQPDQSNGVTAVDADVPSKAAEPFSPPGRIYGRTPDGTVFVVPETEDMVRTLFDPRIKKSLTDMLIVSVLTSYVLLYFVLPSYLRIPVYCILFAFWRLAYNVGIGWLLSQQSNHKRLTKWSLQYHIFDKSNANTFWQPLLKGDFTTKLGKDYDFYAAPNEYNTWLLFRHVVDLILMSDFTNYMMLAISCFSVTSQPFFMIFFRYVAGLTLFLFNLWVKLDAHRVVKDFAWYWGDFFFLEDVQLTFDGVFEMAPHPMYSIGYAGFYGICLITASYTLFFASILAHAAQFAFLILVENPHIEKTYNPPAPLKRKSTLDSDSHKKLRESLQGQASPPHFGGVNSSAVDDDYLATPERHAFLVFGNFHVTRVSDVLTVIAAFYATLLAFLPHTIVWSWFAIYNAFFWRALLSFGFGYALRKQSQEKFLTKLFLKYGRTPDEAYQQWQIAYNFATVMSYASLAVVVIRHIHNPLERPYWPFKYIIGAMLIALQTWTSYSIYESLGEFGWFFGDFFFPEKSKNLTYSGIYRYLNNPERLFGIAGVWGLALISGSFIVTVLAFFWTLGVIFLIKFVEHPHMQKLYGGQIRDQSGVVKTIKRAAEAAKIIPPPVESTVRKVQGSIDKVLHETASAVENFLEQKKLTTGVKDVVKETQVLLKEYPARLTIVRVTEDLHGLDASKYSLTIDTPVSEDQPLTFEYGTEITVKWTADPKHSNRDWIGLYKLTDNYSEEVTKISSQGRWSAIDSTAYENHIDTVKSNNETSGEVVFKGDILPWTTGVYQFRYHHDGKHNCLAISRPFTVIATPIKGTSAGGDGKALGIQLLPIVQRIFVASDFIPPLTVNENWDLEDPVVTKRLGYAVKVYAGVDLAPEVLQSDQSVGQLATRLQRVTDALRPFTAIKKE